MSHYKGRLAELLLEGYQNATARLYCPPEAEPAPGQYLQLMSPKDEEQAVPVSAFATGAAEDEDGEFMLPILCALPESWQPGDELNIRGPLGRGFALPRSARRVALTPLAGGVGRLLPLIPLALAQGAEVVVCSDPAPANLPLAAELRSLEDLPSVLAWADYVAIDVKIEDIEGLAQRPAFRQQLPRAVTAQALVLGPMPCGGLAKCGVCALVTGRGELLACEDGPVFDVRELLVS